MGDEQLAQRLQASAPRQPQPEDFIRGDRLVDLRARRPGDGGYAEVRGVGAGFVTDQATTGVSRKRSEEHTSELQSLMRISYAVFCLKKKKKEQILKKDKQHTIDTKKKNTQHASY